MWHRLEKKLLLQERQRLQEKRRQGSGGLLRSQRSRR